MMQKEPVLKIAGLSFVYPDGRQIFNNFSLTVQSGERVGIIGPNGTGKTTMFLLISGVKKAARGEIKLFDKPVVPGKFRPEVGMVFQNQDDQIFCPSVWDDIAFGPNNMGLSKEEINKRVNEVLDSLEIKSLSERPPHNLSGGEKRLVTLAGVLAMYPRLVIYDEPTSNLDIRYRRRLINFLKSTTQEAMLIASHDLDFIMEACNRVILLHNGNLIADGKPVDIFSNKKLMEDHDLEQPYSISSRVMNS
ncbi:MAG: energy-coupling factor ABC transporter ATP-binding protein [Clostridiales bacterium]|nr:energy-coupling factor ABC transporter ATP-binding protein [Clostridiales bacterium]MCF8022912.1 energy-coupling factor ABC transporter ATP-binding protein [Clostridiales bacterium]